MPATVRMYEDDAARARANYDEIAVAAVAEWERDLAEGKVYAIALDSTELMCLIAACQLAMRHPEFASENAAFGHALRACQKLVEAYPVGGAQRTLAAQGFDPRFDVPSRVDG